MDQKRPYNDIPNGDTAPVPPVSGDTVPLPAPGEGTPAPETDNAAPENVSIAAPAAVHSASDTAPMRPAFMQFPPFPCCFLRAVCPEMNELPAFPVL